MSVLTRAAGAGSSLTLGWLSRRFRVFVWKLAGSLCAAAAAAGRVQVDILLLLLLLLRSFEDVCRGGRCGFICWRVLRICETRSINLLCTQVIWNISDLFSSSLPLTAVLLARQLPLQGALPVELHAFTLLLRQGGGSWGGGNRSRGGVDRSREVIREAHGVKRIWISKDLHFRRRLFFS